MPLPLSYAVAIVDDDESLCRSMARLLLASGFRPVTYLSAEAFLDDVKHSRFNCLILDVQLGDISGIELQEQLVAAGSTTPVIFLTAHDEAGVRERAIRAGCVSFLHKRDSGEAVIRALIEAIH
jgi:FixJ family two-component response regulator